MLTALHTKRSKSKEPCTFFWAQKASSHVLNFHTTQTNTQKVKNKTFQNNSVYTTPPAWVSEWVSVLVEHQSRELLNSSRALGEPCVLSGDEHYAVLVRVVINVLQLGEEAVALVALLTRTA